MSERMPATTPIRLRNLLWLPLAGAAWLALEYYGTPHLRYAWEGFSMGRGPDAPVYFRRCDYVGLHSFRLHPRDGKCPVFMFAKREAINVR